MRRYVVALLIITMGSLFVSERTNAARGYEVVSKGAKRVALVVGNGDYKVSPLKNPTNDANDVAAKLRRLGFDVTLVTNADNRMMEQQIGAFREKLSEADIRLFYYAGHGMQVNGTNYLLPVEIDVQYEDEVKYEAVDAGRILDSMASAGKGANIVVLDACRNNPFKRSFRSSATGLSRMQELDGAIIVYATSPGSVAEDGEGRNGMFTRYFLQYLSEPGLTVDQIFKKTGRAVAKMTDNRQRPWISLGLYEDVYLSPISQTIQPGKLDAVQGQSGNGVQGYSDFRYWATDVTPVKVVSSLENSAVPIIAFGPTLDKTKPNDIRSTFQSLNADLTTILKSIVDSRTDVECIFSPATLHGVGRYQYKLKLGAEKQIWGTSPNIAAVRSMASEMKCDYLFFVKGLSHWREIEFVVWMYDVQHDQLKSIKQKSSLSFNYRGRFQSMLKSIMKSFFEEIQTNHS